MIFIMTLALVIISVTLIITRAQLNYWRSMAKVYEESRDVCLGHYHNLELRHEELLVKLRELYRDY